MQVRNTKPEKGNKFYNTPQNGGLNRCIKGYPEDKDCDVLSNCVGYACGRFNEIIGEMKYPYLNCNAENFIERVRDYYNLEVVNYPTIGGIMVFQKGATLNSYDGAGHVFIVEKYINKSNIQTSESAYGGSAFYTKIRNVTNNYDMGNYKFLGCIVNPKIGKMITYPNPEFNETYYIVKPGDTLSGIASQFKTTYQVLARINNIANPNLIYPGQKIKTTDSDKYYTVKSGDTLSGIALLHNTTYQELARINNIDNPNLIYPGQKIKIND